MPHRTNAAKAAAAAASLRLNDEGTDWSADTTQQQQKWQKKNNTKNDFGCIS